jgi:hypothetical protein
LNNALTKSTSYYARKLSKYSAVLLVLFTSFGFMGTANAVQTGQVTITCAKSDGTARTFNVGWDNANQFFAGKGDIARLYCEGGFSGGGHTTFVSTSVTDLALRYYNGAIPLQVDTPTAIVETQTPQAQETPTSVVVDSPSASPDSPTVDVSDTPTLVVDSGTALDTVTVSDTPTVIVDTSTTETETPLVIQETQTPELPISQPEPLPTPVPEVVQPQPIVIPEPQPVILPEPEPEPSEPESDVEPDLLDPEEELPVDEPILPDEEPSERPIEEETNEIPSDPEIQEPIEPTPEPLPQPVVESEPTSPPDIAPVTPNDSEPMVTLDNGVVLTEEEAAAVVLLSNPAELLSELFSDPGAVLSALGSVGADMTPEEREKSEKVILASVIAGNIATQAAATAGAVAAYRRKP